MQETKFQIHKIILVLGLTLGLGFGLTGCEDDETNSVAKAQDCLDKARTSPEAAACRSLIEGKSSQQANIVRCAIEFVAGGLTTSKVADAFKGKEEAAGKQEAKLMALLSLGSTAIADQAVVFCNLSGIPGLQYIANLSLLGTYMTVLGSSTDPAAFLATCSGGNVCNDTVVGTAVINMGESYCAGGNSDSDVCSKINGAINNSGGNPDAVAQQLYALLNAP